jgi:thiol-disulfide isomerase/thioredoxin
MKTLFSLLLISVTLFAAPRTGNHAVSFTLPDIYNFEHTHTDESYRGKLILLNIWASWCSGCQEEMPLFVKIQQQFSKKKFEIVLVNIDSQRQSAIDFLHTVDPIGILSTLYDKDKSLAKAYRCPGMPSSFLIDKNGKIIDVYIGSFDKESIKKMSRKISELTKD